MPTPRKIDAPGSGRYLKARAMTIGQCIEGIFMGRTYSEEYKSWGYLFYTTEHKLQQLGGTQQVDALFENAGISLDINADDFSYVYIWLTKTSERITKNGNTFIDFDLAIGDIDDEASSQLSAEAVQAYNESEAAF
jgi:hypothetical protein